MIRIRLTGGVRIYDHDGQDVTPRGKKTRGMVALLALAPDFLRPRTRLQDRLWSDRPQEQGAASLRQSLSELRRCLGPARDAVISRGGEIQLDPENFAVDEREDIFAGTMRDTAKLCEGLDIRDAEFENWLRDLRIRAGRNSASAPPPVASDRQPRPLLLIGGSDGACPASRWARAHLCGILARSLSEYGPLRIIDTVKTPDISLESSQFGLFLDIGITGSGPTRALHLRLESASGHWLIWQAPECTVGLDCSDADAARLDRLAHATALAVMEASRDHENRGSAESFALALASRARAKCLRFSRQELRAADGLFAAAHEAAPRGVYLAWRGFLRNTAAFEHLTRDFLEPLDQAALYHEAMRDDPQNSMTLALTAQQSFLDGDLSTAQHLCGQALRFNPANPLAWGFDANMRLLSNDIDGGTRASRIAARLVEGQDYQGFWSIFSCMSAMARQDYQAAIAHGRLGLIYAPEFIAIRRFLFALYRATGQYDSAHQIQHEIRQREPGFHPKLLASKSYPVATLQRMPIAERI